MIVIRKATIKDLSNIEYLRKENAKYLGFIPKNTYSIALKSKVTKQKILVATSSNKVIGYIYGSLYDKRDREAKIYQTAVSSKYRGKCIGTLLVKEFEHYVKDSKITNIRLRIRFDFYKARCFYTNLGYYCVNSIDNIRVYYKNI